MSIHRAVWLESLERRRLFAVGDVYADPGDPRTETGLSGGWKFSFAPAGDPAAPAYDDAAWAAVTLPHTWNAFDAQDGIGGANGYARGVGWYRCTVTRPPAAAGERLLLAFDAASLVTGVYVDGVAVGTHAGAFAAFNVDVTARLADDKPHTLAVKCDTSSSWNQTVAPSSGAAVNVDGGLYRGVRLVAVSPTHVATDADGSSGVFFSTPAVSASSAAVRVQTNLSADAGGGAVVVRSVLADAAGVIVADVSTPRTLAAGDATLTQTAAVASPHLWAGRADPYLYDLHVEVRDTAGVLLDVVDQRVGIRTAAFDAKQGFLLNGKPYDLHGVMYQPDRYNKGWAISDADVRSDFQTVLDLGATVVRSHVQLPALFYDLADAAGVVVVSEITLNGSRDRSQTYGYDAFLANAKQQLRELVWQNFNRPSAVNWGLYNELVDNTANNKLLSALNQYAHTLDATRPTFGAGWNAKIGTLEKKTDTLAFNRYYGWYYGQPADLGPFLDAMHAAAPTLPIAVSEYGAGGSTVQHGDLAAVSPYGKWQSEEFQNEFNEKTYPILAARNYLWAKIQFQLFDNINDQYTAQPNPGYNNKGLLTRDHALRKDSFFYYQANWSDKPVLYLTSRRWTSRAEASVEVKAYANTDAPKLYLNGTYAGDLVSRGYGVWSLPSVALANGANVVTIVASKNGQTYTDTATWTCTAVTSPPPPGTGSIRGTVFGDINKNGIYDTGDTLGPGRTVWLDLDDDGVLDANEPSVVTRADGTFAFTGLAARAYHVRRTFPTGYVESTPAQYVTLTVGQAVTGADIGSKSK